MKQHLLLIRTIMPDSTPSPRPSLIADLVDSVLKVPGMRVASVEVVEIGSSETITRRIRKTGSEATSAPASVENVSHRFVAPTESSEDKCIFCGLPKEKHHV